MRTLFLIIPIFIISSCGNDTAQLETKFPEEESNQTTLQNNYPDAADIDDAAESNTESEIPQSITPNQQSWDDYQDSLRKVLYKSKKNKLLKESFLQEYYLRNVVDVKNDTLYFNFGFDIHGYDCGAPDCYTTRLSFKFKLGDSLIFPIQLNYLEKETGCVDKETKLKSEFVLKERTNEVVIYYDEANKRNLILFSTNKKRTDYAYYIVGLKNEFTSVNVVNKLIKLENSTEEKNAISAFRSHALFTNEYDGFLK